MSRAKGLFITGTNTGVGKTHVTAVLAIALRQRGLRVGVMKPVETGCSYQVAFRDAISSDTEASSASKTNACEIDTEERNFVSVENGQLQPLDSLFLRQISGCTAPQELVTPYTFAEPLAPALAAQHVGQSINLDHIVQCYEQLANEHDIVLVEGAGGLLVPLTRDRHILDLAARLGLPILVVARNILGTINHTALTVTVAKQYCQVSGIVLNTLTAEAQDPSQASNAEALRLWGGAPLLGEVSYMLDVTPEGLLRQSEGIALGAIFGGKG